MKLGNRQIGAVGVAKVAAALFRNGYSVLTPMEDFAGYDLVAEKGGKFIRIQVKTTSGMERGKSFYRFVTCKGSRKKLRYYGSNVDYVVCHATDEDLFWSFPVNQCRTASKKLHPRSGSSWRILSDL
ncbi:MAG: hypothetical protein EBR82_87840 [Caulobacteraceae bacterium]|nr:hypothetical protein [Caulobacteraceae bacterium]